MVWSVCRPTASFTCTCKIRWVPPCRSKPSLMGLEKLSRTCASEVGTVGNRPNPKRHNKTTSVIKMTFHLRLDSIGSFHPRESSWSSAVALPKLCFLAFHLDPGYRRARHFSLHLVGDTQLYGIAVQRHDRSVEPSARDHLVSGFEGAQHGLGFLLPPLRRKNQQYVENHHDDRQR